MNIGKNVYIEDGKINSLRLSFVDYFQFLLLFIYLFLVMADFRYGVENYIMIALLFIWLFIAYTFTTRLFINIFFNKKNLLFLIFSVFYILPQIIIGIKSLEIVKGYFAILLVIAPFFIADYYRLRFGDSFFYFISKVIIAFFLFLSVRTLFLLANTPKAARYLTYGSSADNYENMAQFAGVGGGYNLAYALCLILPVLFYQLVKKTHMVWWKKIIYLLIGIVFLLTVVRSDFGMAFILLFLGFIGILLAYASKKSRMKFFLFITSVGLILTLLREPLGNMIIDLSETVSGVIGVRLNSLGNFLNGNIALQEVSSRVVRNKISVDTFLNYPLLGASVVANYNLETLRHIYIGNHSDLLDTLAKYGVLAGLPFIMYYYYSIKQIIVRMRKAEDKIILSISSGLFILLALFNYVNVTSIIIAIAFVNPGIILLFNNYLRTNDFSKDNREANKLIKEDKSEISTHIL